MATSAFLKTIYHLCMETFLVSPPLQANSLQGFTIGRADVQHPHAINTHQVKSPWMKRIMTNLSQSTKTKPIE